ncbi:MAG: hypothetical protein USCAAHI_01360 [Beijerinckiaceae bacterium]|nr:MAG: hypothetical protein USCAAHI_01360 [Beijerinckiaceae bacterium]
MRKSVIINLACIFSLRNGNRLLTHGSWKDVLRLGRKTRLPEQQRVALWSMFARVRADLASRGVITVSEMFTKLAWAIASSKTPPFDLAVVDEAQDTSALPICDSSRHLARTGRMHSSSPAISDSEFFNSLSRGWHWGSIYAGAAGTFASTTGLHTRFACRRIVCWDPKCPMPTETPKNAATRSGSSMVRPKTMSTLSNEKSRNPKSATPKKGSAKSNAPSRRNVTSTAATAKTPLKADEANVERLTKQERVLTLLSQPEGASIVEMMQATD